MFTRLFTFILFSSLVGALTAQNPISRNYYTGGFLPFKSGPFTFEQPFIGGLNSPQFQTMDLNNDGEGDLIIFDKNDGKYLPFLRKNKNSFQYAPQYESCLPKAYYYAKTADLNSDGKLDVFTLDETRNLVIYRNITQAGDSFPKFLNLGQQMYRNQYDTNFFILFNAFSLSNTDLPEISDIDGDGDLDILAYDAFYNIYALYKDVRIEKGWNTDTFQFQKWDVCYGYFNDFNNTINLGNCPYKLKLKLRHSGGSACFMFDADEDGDKEMVLSNIGQKHMAILYNGRVQYSHEYDTMIAWDSIFPQGTTRATDYEFPAGFLFDADGDGVQDLITAPNGFVDVRETNQTWYYRNFGKTNKPDFKYEKSNFIADKTLDLGAQSAPAFCDADADGDMDMFVASNGDFSVTGGVKDRIAFFENKGTLTKPSFELADADYMNLSSKGFSDLILRFGDVDGDKDIDLVTGDRLGYVRWYKNTEGTGKPVKFVLANSDLVGANYASGEGNAAPLVFNYNNDTLPDLLVGYYHGMVILYVNKGSVGNPAYDRAPTHAWGMRANQWLTNVSVPGFASFGYAVPELVDIEGDGVDEILLGTAYGVPRLYRPSGRSVYDSLSSDSTWLWQKGMGDSTIPDFGYRIVPAATDITGDSIPEIFFGCSRGGLQLASSKGTVLGIHEPKGRNPIASFDLFPNPANTMIWIRRNNVAENWNIVIKDMSGRTMLQSALLKSETSVGLQIGALGAGMYYAEISNGSSKGFRKFLIQRH